MFHVSLLEGAREALSVSFRSLILSICFIWNRGCVQKRSIIVLHRYPFLILSETISVWVSGAYNTTSKCRNCSQTDALFKYEKDIKYCSLHYPVEKEMTSKLSSMPRFDSSAGQREKFSIVELPVLFEVAISNSGIPFVYIVVLFNCSFLICGLFEVVFAKFLQRWIAPHCLHPCQHFRRCSCQWQIVGSEPLLCSQYIIPQISFQHIIATSKSLCCRWQKSFDMVG